MSDESIDLIAYKQLVGYIIETIPTHHQIPKTIEDIACKFQDAHEDMSLQEAKTLVSTVLSMLDLLGVLNLHEGTYRSLNQVPTYFLQSLTWYFKHNICLLDNWTRIGVNTDVSLGALLDTAPQFLKVMESKRRQVSKEQGIEATPSRKQLVVVVLVKGNIGKKTYYLHEWDRRAEQFQLIGGRVEPGESLIAAARREFIEELDIEREQKLEYERDFELELLSKEEQPIALSDISPTYGALTEYLFWVYTAWLKVQNFELRDNNRWLSIEEMLEGRTKSGKQIGNSDLYRKINDEIPGGLDRIPISVEIKSTKNYWDYLEVKPSLWGVEFDLKRLVGDFLILKDSETNFILRKPIVLCKQMTRYFSTNKCGLTSQQTV